MGKKCKFVKHQKLKIGTFKLCSRSASPVSHVVDQWRARGRLLLHRGPGRGHGRQQPQRDEGDQVWREIQMSKEERK